MPGNKNKRHPPPWRFFFAIFIPDKTAHPSKSTGRRWGGHPAHAQAMRLYLARPLRAIVVSPDDSPHVLYDALHPLPAKHYTIIHNGKAVLPTVAASLAELGFRHQDFVRITPRLPGGGGDGGVYPPTVHELAWMNDIGGGTKRQAWAVLGGSVRRTQYEKISTGLRRYEACTTCALSGAPLSVRPCCTASTKHSVPPPGQPLREPVVCCELGSLYNKEAVLEALLAKAEKPLDERFSHIRSMKDLHAVQLHKNTAYTASATSVETAETGDAPLDAPYQCPVTKLPFNGRHAFYLVRPTGHVVSERALSMMEFKACPVTETPLAPPAPAGHAAEGPGGAGPSRPSPATRSLDLLELIPSEDVVEEKRKRLAEVRASRKRSKSTKGGNATAKMPRQHKTPVVHGAPSASDVPQGEKASSAGLAFTRIATQVEANLTKQQESSAVKDLFISKETRRQAEEATRAGKDYMTRAVKMPGAPVPDRSRAPTG